MRFGGHSADPFLPPMPFSEWPLREVMVLTYEDAPVEETMPYFGCRLAPATPNLFFGRSAKRPPHTKASCTVFDWFKDNDLAHVLVSFFGRHEQGGPMRFGAGFKHPEHPREDMLGHAFRSMGTENPLRVLQTARGCVHILSMDCFTDKEEPVALRRFLTGRKKVSCMCRGAPCRHRLSNASTYAYHQRKSASRTCCRPGSRTTHCSSTSKRTSASMRRTAWTRTSGCRS